MVLFLLLLVNPGRSALLHVLALSLGKVEGGESPLEAKNDANFFTGEFTSVTKVPLVFEGVLLCNTEDLSASIELAQVTSLS